MNWTVFKPEEAGLYLFQDYKKSVTLVWVYKGISGMHLNGVILPNGGYGEWYGPIVVPEKSEEVPASFKKGIKDLESGNTVPMDVALNEVPSDEPHSVCYGCSIGCPFEGSKGRGLVCGLELLRMGGCK